MIQSLLLRVRDSLKRITWITQWSWWTARCGVTLWNLFTRSVFLVGLRKISRTENLTAKSARGCYGPKCNWCRSHLPRQSSRNINLSHCLLPLWGRTGLLQEANNTNLSGLVAASSWSLAWPARAQQAHCTTNMWCCRLCLLAPPVAILAGLDKGRITRGQTLPEKVRESVGQTAQNEQQV